jgi:tetratricopeptide (TPR) repeat protein
VNSFAIRSALVVMALLVGAWLALGVRAVALENDSESVLNRARAGPIPAAEANKALDDLAKAGRLSPDQGPLINQGELLAAVGRDDEARAVAKRATDAEPDNLQAWFLAWVVADPDPVAKAHAKARLLELNPWFAWALRRR